MCIRDRYINLPRIVVLGTQSSGKSTLLESIMGLDFLPRGEGVVTRRPLELRLVHTVGADKPWAVFEQDKTKKYFDFMEVRQKIDELTDLVAGKKKGIVDDPIVLTVYSAECPDLTLVDLPGVTRIPLAGSDQPKDIERITREMASRYCRDPRTIILCVIPANSDISTSDALQMAQQIDPQGTRTVGVLTKIDIMDRGTNAKRMILGQDIHLKLGFVGVKGRSQQDINDKVRVKKAIDSERQFFATDPVYSTFPPGYLGTDVLIDKLTKILFKHIRTLLPEIIKEINSRVKDCETRLRDLGPSLPKTNNEKMQLVWNMITEFSENFKNSLRGKFDHRSGARFDKQNVSGSASIKMLFAELYEEFVEKGFKATNDYSDKDIEKAIIMHQGDSIPGFPSIDSFLYLVKPQLEKLREPAIECVNNVYVYLESLSVKIMNRIFYRFPQLIEDVSEIVIKVLQDERDQTRQMVENLIDAEEGYLFTNDYSYLMSRATLIPQQKQDAKQIDPNKLFIEEMRNRIDSYFSLVVRNIRDTIPKLIGFFLVRQSEERMQFSLYNEINKSFAIMESLGEPAHVAQERETLSRTLETLKKAQKVLKKDPDLAVTMKETEEDDSSPNQAGGADGKKATTNDDGARNQGQAKKTNSSLFG
eukprot:TRINITY_DN483_c0_g2_i2.p1 TRINITY_DN483_c0_g2~~TRINITY_DN483_c0_g2_i2.p1  ORF type:complete len:647 (+),score=143.12 TRINITY_DN483_c0_g2_i2:65-2005(+)